jgi:hypothetical protein
MSYSKLLYNKSERELMMDIWEYLHLIVEDISSMKERQIEMNRKLSELSRRKTGIDPKKGK